MMLAETPVAQKYLRYRNKKHDANHESKVWPETREPTLNQNDEAPKLKSMARYRRPKGMFKTESKPHPAIPTTPLSSLIVPAEISQTTKDIEVVVLSPLSTQEKEDVNTERLNLWKLGRIEEIETVDVQAASLKSKQSTKLDSTEALRVTLEETEQRDGEFYEKNHLTSRSEESESQGHGSPLSPNQMQKATEEINHRESEACTSPHPSNNPQDSKSKELGSPLSQTQTQIAIEKQKILDLQRLEAELDAAPSSPKFPPLQNPKKNKLIELISKKTTSRYTPPSTPKNSTPSTLTKSSPESQQSKGIEQGGRGIVPQIDAPISAANAKERRVLIRYKNTSINLPVNLNTTPANIIQSAADTMTQKINPSTTVLIESYAPLGLSRCLRSHEHIRNVLNSWDRDTQNALIIEPQDPSNMSLLSSEPPVDLTFNLYHSQKRGKWKKRHVNILVSGQMYICKKINAKSTDKDYVNICHLSDFDIYKLNSPKTQKNLNPPKKYCYAIKSQQKSIMFLNTENFVHYFSTDDDALAESFHNAVQKWRSWYLINHMEESCNSSKNDRTIHTSSTIASVDDENNKDTSQPLLGLSSDDSKLETDDKFDDRFPQIPFLHRSSRQFYSAALRESERESDEFPSSSLLGRTYSQRKRELDDSSNLRSMASVRRPGTSSKSGQNSLNQRSLLDFTPSPKDLPPWKRPGKGQGIRVTKGVPLIEVATTPGLPHDIMSSITVLKRDESGITHNEKPGPISSLASEGPFVKGGLISGGFGVMGKSQGNYPNRTRR